MGRILLVKPFVFLHRNQNLELPLGIMMLSAYLKQRLGGRVTISLLDLRLERNRTGALFDVLRSERPDIVGLSLMNFERPFLEQSLAPIREAAPNALIVAGGAYPTAHAKEVLLSFPAVDIVVCGEGEETFLDVVENHLSGRDVRGIPGTVFREGRNIVYSSPRPFIEPLDRLPMPDYGSVDIERYFVPHTPMNVISAHNRYVILMTSRGCPYQCAYCHEIMGKIFRPHSPERVLAEIRHLYDRYGIREFHIVDDIFNLDRERMRRILHGVIEQGLKVYFAFPNGIRGDFLDKEDIVLMKEAGVYNMTFSIETATPRIQELVGKRLDVGKAMKNIRYAHHQGIVTKAYFMVGFPTETVEEIERTFSLSRDPALDMVSYFKVAPFSHTRLYRMLRKMDTGDEKGEEPIDYFTGRSWYEKKTDIPLNRMIFWAYLRFYFPWRLWRLLWRLPRPFAFLSRSFYHLSLIFHLRRKNS